MIPMEETGEHSAVRTQATLPAFPSPGIGALLQIACLAVGMRNSGHPDDVVDQWRSEALAAIRPPSPTDSLAPEGKH